MRSLATLIILTAATLAACDKPAAPVAATPAAPNASPSSAVTSAGDGKEVIITDANFQSEVLDSKQPVLVDIWATWCGPCKKAAPTIAALAKEYSGKVKVGKLDSDSNQKIASQYVREGIPLFLVFKDGKVVHQVTGFANDQGLRAQLKPALEAALK